MEDGCSSSIPSSSSSIKLFLYVNHSASFPSYLSSSSESVTAAASSLGRYHDCAVVISAPLLPSCRPSFPFSLAAWNMALL